MKKTLVTKYLRVLSLSVLTLFTSHVQSSDIGFENFKGQVGYFKELTLGQYAKTNDNKIIKWVGDLNVFVDGDISESLNSELNLLIAEINDLVGGDKLNRVDSEDQANFVILTGSSGTDYLNYQPEAHLDYNERFGNFLMIPNSVPERAAAGFLIYTNESSQIIYGSMYMDLRLFGSDEYRVYAHHIFRQLITQSLGIPYKSRKYGDSIFSNHPSLEFVTRYSDLDRLIIKNLYSNCVKAGMNKFELDSVFESDC